VARRAREGHAEECLDHLLVYRLAGVERRERHLKQSARRIILGSRAGIAGTVYGTIVVMAALTAGSEASPDLWQLSAIVATSVLVIWIAHVYAHGLGESIDRGRRLDKAELAEIAHRELAIPLAAAAPIVALVLGALGFVRDTRAIWLALAIALATLMLQGARYAAIEHLSRTATLVSIGINTLLGLVIVALKAGLSH
jgi:hypothetical protein